MKQRVKEIIDSDGVSRFMLQYRFMFMWCNEQLFSSYEEAKTYQAYIYEKEVIIHKLD